MDPATRGAEGAGQAAGIVSTAGKLHGHFQGTGTLQGLKNILSMHWKEKR